MALDLFKNFAKVQVSTGYDASATSVVLAGGHGAKLPTAPFNATWWDSSIADPTDDPNVEIVRVTAVAADTLTVTRGQEGTSATPKNTAGQTYKMIAGLTAKTFNTDLSMVPQVLNGRLTLESGVPGSITDQTAKTTIYYTPFQGNCISVYAGSMWVCRQFAEIALPLGTLVAGKNYDVFAYDSAGAIALELGAAWTSDTVRAEALVLQDGVHVKSGALTRRYLGTFRTTTTTTTEDSLLRRFVWSRATTLGRDLFFSDTTPHTYDGLVRMWAANAEARVQFVSGLAEELVTINVSAELISGAGIFVIGAVGLDSLSAYRTLEAYAQQSGGSLTTKISATEAMSPQIGYHALNLTQRTFSGSGNFNAGGISAVFRC
jgi:hypothetical protein